MTMPTYSTLPVAAEVRPAESLAELAAMIVADAELFAQSDRDQLPIALRMGMWLDKARAECKAERRSFVKWLKENVKSLKQSKAYNCLKVYEMRENFPQDGKLGYSDALKMAYGWEEDEEDDLVPEGWEVIGGDCLAELEQTPKGEARLVFADPPYNIGVDYGDGGKADSLPDAEYVAWAARWIGLCRDALADDGSLWVLIADEYAGEYNVALKDAGFTIRNWIIWYETFGVNCPGKFNRTHRHLFYCVKDRARFVFHADEPAVRRMSDRQTKWDDPRRSERDVD